MWIQTYTGLAFDPLRPRQKDINITDIAHALSMICRFGGHCDRFYSVAEHSIRVAVWLQKQLDIVKPGKSERALLFGALMHDAHEAYIGDVTRPLKRVLYATRSNTSTLESFTATEDRLKRAIMKRFNVKLTKIHRGWVKEADDTMLATEADQLMERPPKSWERLPKPDLDRIDVMDPMTAKSRFLNCARVWGGIK